MPANGALPGRRQSLELLMTSLESLTEAGHSAMKRGAWREAAEVWEQLRKRRPEDLVAYSHGGWALREAGRAEEADRVLTDGILRFPGDPWLAIHHIWAAGDLARWTAVVELCESFRTAVPEWPFGYVQGAFGLRQLGRLGAADTLLREAADAFPDDIEVHREFARMAAHRSDWAAAVERWAALKARFPDDLSSDPEIRAADYEFRLSCAGQGRDFAAEAAENSAMGGASAAPGPEDADAAAVMNRFESIGDNCEFAFVQRHFGSEPMSLLRWGYANTDMVLSGLAAEYAGVGEPEFTQLSAYPDGEIVIHDARYFSWVHSGAYESAVDDKDKFFKDVCVRLKFLRRKFMRDVKAAEKIYICRRHEGIPDEEAIRLYEALQSHGDNWLCCVRRADQDHPRGTLIRLRDKLLVGYSDLVHMVASEPIPHESWLAICRVFLQEIEQKTTASASPPAAVATRMVNAS